MLQFAIENLVTDETILAPNMGFDQCWEYAKVWLQGDIVEGNAYVHELTMFDPSTYRSPYEPGQPMLKATRLKLKEMTNACLANSHSDHNARPLNPN